MKSDQLNIKLENDALAFLYHLADRGTGTEALDMLSKAIRYNYLKASKIISALRKSTKLKRSEHFFAAITDELLERAKGKPCVDSRRAFYDSSRAQGRQETEGEDQAQRVVLEILNWAKASRADNVAQKERKERLARNTSVDQYNAIKDHYNFQDQEAKDVERRFTDKNFFQRDRERKEKAVPRYLSREGREPKNTSFKSFDASVIVPVNETAAAAKKIRNDGGSFDLN